MANINQDAKQFAISVVSRVFQNMDQQSQKQALAGLRTTIPDLQMGAEQEVPSKELWTNTIAPRVVDFYARSYQSENLRNTG